jgi:hypothetical protein
VPGIVEVAYEQIFAKLVRDLLEVPETQSPSEGVTGLLRRSVEVACLDPVEP